MPPPDPQPLTMEEVGRLTAEAFRLDADWGALVWLTMVTGARRGELCAPRWRHVDLNRGVVTIRRAIAENGNDTEEKDTKTHQRRHVTLDPSTMVVAEYRQWLTILLRCAHHWTGTGVVRSGQLSAHRRRRLVARRLDHGRRPRSMVCPGLVVGTLPRTACPQSVGDTFHSLSL